jgi:hypothetical protein
MSVRIIVAAAAVSAITLAGAAICEAAPLDYEYFKARVQPIFLAKRPGHAPCVMCHAEANNMLRLQPLPHGRTAWSEDDTRKNFDTVSKIVEAADDPLQSKILMHPLAPEAGGDAYHNGGRQFADRNDPDWRTIADWATGAALEKK